MQAEFEVVSWTPANPGRSLVTVARLPRSPVLRVDMAELLLRLLGPRHGRALPTSTWPTGTCRLAPAQLSSSR